MAWLSVSASWGESCDHTAEARAPKARISNALRCRPDFMGVDERAGRVI